MEVEFRSKPEWVQFKSTKLLQQSELGRLKAQIKKIDPRWIKRKKEERKFISLLQTLFDELEVKINDIVGLENFKKGYSDLYKIRELDYFNYEWDTVEKLYYRLNALIEGLGYTRVEEGVISEDVMAY
jgi:hypothetical protein